MAANPLYYTKRHSMQIQAACPQMTQERYMEGYDRANSLVNTMIGVANEVARIAIADGIDAIRYGVDYSPLFIRGRYDGPLYTWKRICDIYVKTDDPADYINLNDDANMRLAADVLARKLSDSDVLNRIGKHAIELNLEVASRYTSEDDLKEIGVEA